MKRFLFQVEAISLLFSIVAASAETIVFGSPVIELAVRSAIHQPTGPIDSLDVTGLTVLDVEGFLVSSLDGLEFLTGLTTLRLSNNEITDVSPLEGLTNLQTLNLGMNMIENVTGLAGLADLVALDLSDNLVDALGPLAGLTSLQTLDLENNAIVDASPLLDNGGLGAGDTVNLFGNPLSQASLCNVILPLVGRGVNALFDGECPGIVEGTVFNAATGQPINDALVVAFSPVLGRGVGTTDFDGNFRMPDLASGEYLLTAYAPGFTPLSKSASIGTSMTTTVTFSLVPVTNEDLTRVFGSATDFLTTHAIAGIEAEAFTPTGASLGPATYTGPSGEFVLFIPVDLSGGMITAEFSAPGYDDVTVPINTASTDPVQIEISPRSRPTGSIRGNVFDGTLGTHATLDGARVTVKASGGVLAFSDTTNIAGAFEITNLADGEYSVQISAPTHPGDGIRRTVIVSDGAPQNISQTLGSIPTPGGGVGGGCASGRAGPSQHAAADLLVLIAASVIGWVRRRPRSAR